MNSIKKPLSCLLLGISILLNAGENCCLDDIQFEATLFYFKPSLEQNSYVITSTDNRFNGEVYPNGKRHFIHTEYKPGFRLETLNELCNPATLLNLRFTCYNSHPSSFTRGPFLFDTVGFPGHGAGAPEDTTYNGFARMRHQYQYYAADSTINRYLVDCFPDTFTFLFGIHYSYVKVKHKFRGVGTFLTTEDGQPVARPVNNRLHEKSIFWGIGPEIGVDYSYLFQICNREGYFALNINARAALLGTCNDVDFHYRTERTGPRGVNLKNDKLWRITPMCDAQIGLSYTCSFYDAQAAIEFGYEFVWYSKAVDKITGYDVALAGNSLDVLDDFTLQGPFLRMVIQF